MHHSKVEQVGCSHYVMWAHSDVITITMEGMGGRSQFVFLVTFFIPNTVATSNCPNHLQCHSSTLMPYPFSHHYYNNPSTKILHLFHLLHFLLRSSLHTASYFNPIFRPLYCSCQLTSCPIHPIPPNSTPPPPPPPPPPHTYVVVLSQSLPYLTTRSSTSTLVSLVVRHTLP